MNHSNFSDSIQPHNEMSSANSNDNLVRLSDYQPYPLEIISLELTLELDETSTLVTSLLHYKSKSTQFNPALLNGENLALQSIEIKTNTDFRPLTNTECHHKPDGLMLQELPSEGILKIKVMINPKKNRHLQGLYISNGIFTTQCEAEGFKRITYYPARPDVLSIFTTHIIAPKENKKGEPITARLSNGNKIAERELSDGRILTSWHDPFKKPAYLFAMVAGHLTVTKDEFITRSGQHVELNIWSEPQYHGRTNFAMSALKRAMRWDEDKFNLEYDLDIFQIVAVSDFNFGAMENKSLNIFNAKYLLVDPEVSSDDDYMNVEAIVAHEYFHNWTGNRITLRDWFQLSLKEGLTVYREFEYTMDWLSRDAARLGQVQYLRSSQFAEDASGLSHPVRPHTYKAIDNFYTATVYEKGAELIRMLATVLGDKKFSKGFAHYIKTYDGCAATVENFINSFQDANQVDCAWLMPWYETPGTPNVKVTEKYDINAKKFSVTLEQNNLKSERLLTIPLKLALFDYNGTPYPLIPNDKNNFIFHGENIEAVYMLSQKTATISFNNIARPPRLSLNRGFSAPVDLIWQRTNKDLSLALKTDNDSFNRWQAGQDLAKNLLIKHYYNQDTKAEKSAYNEAFAVLLQDKSTNRLILAETLTMPNFEEILRYLTKPNAGKNEIGVDPLRLWQTYQTIKQELGKKFHEELKQCYFNTQTKGNYEINKDGIANRALNAVLLNYWVAGANTNQKDEILVTLQQHYYDSNNYTDRREALRQFNRLTVGAWQGDKNAEKIRTKIFTHYFHKVAKDELAFDNYIKLVASYDHPDTLSIIQQILASSKIFSPDGKTANNFYWDKPNYLYSLLLSFISNINQFYQPASYQLIFDVAEKLDTINSHVASRLMPAFNLYQQLSDKYKNPIAKLLQNFKQKKLSPQLLEMVERLES